MHVAFQQAQFPSQQGQWLMFILSTVWDSKFRKKGVVWPGHSGGHVHEALAQGSFG